MFREDVKYLQPREFDRRDYIANKVLKDMDKIKAPKAFKRDIKETYDQ